MSRPQPLRIAAIPGSLRRLSHNRFLLEHARRIAPSRFRIELLDLGDVPPFNEDLERNEPGGPRAVRALREAIDAADGLLIATPEYNQSIPGVLKNALDWLSRPAPDEVMIGKPVAILGASTGRWGTRLAQAALRQTLAATEALTLPSPMLFVRDAAEAFDADGALVDATTEASLRRLLDSFGRWIDTLRPETRGVA